MGVSEGPIAGRDIEVVGDWSAEAGGTAADRDLECGPGGNWLLSGRRKANDAARPPRAAAGEAHVGSVAVEGDQGSVPSYWLVHDR